MRCLFGLCHCIGFTEVAARLKMFFKKNTNGVIGTSCNFCLRALQILVNSQYVGIEHGMTFPTRH